MALYIESKNTLFIHLYKTGGNSIREGLIRSCEQINASTQEILGAHSNVIDLKTEP